ncbi:hypothetical protein AAMO2058_000683800 [Amorphochlora amoebiformis]
MYVHMFYDLTSYSNSISIPLASPCHSTSPCHCADITDDSEDREEFEARANFFLAPAALRYLVNS